MDLYTFDGDFEVLNVDNKKKVKKFKNEFEKKRERVDFLFKKTFFEL